VILGLLVAVAIGFSNAQGTYNKAAFENAMEAAIKNTRLLLNSLIAEDWDKAQSSGQALAKNAQAMRGLTPKTAANRIGEFQAHADSLAAQSARVVAAAKAHDSKLATQGFGQMIQTCSGCHSVFRDTAMPFPPIRVRGLPDGIRSCLPTIVSALSIVATG
jgi:cytochrome c556